MGIALIQFTTHGDNFQERKSRITVDYLARGIIIGLAIKKARPFVGPIAKEFL